MKKVMLIGPGGSGKSTLSRKLGLLLKLPVYHLDALHWKQGWVPTPDDEWDDLQKELIKEMSGSSTGIMVAPLIFDFQKLTPLSSLISQE